MKKRTRARKSAAPKSRPRRRVTPRASSSLAARFKRRGYKAEFVGTSGYPIDAYVKHLGRRGDSEVEVWVMKWDEEPSELPKKATDRVFATLIVDGEQSQNFDFPSAAAFFRAFK